MASETFISTLTCFILLRMENQSVQK